MKRHVGTYQLGWRWVDLYVDPSLDGASFQVMPNGSHKPRAEIVVGTDGDTEDCWQNLCHESLELALSDCSGRFKPDAAFASASDMYQFSFNHNQFTEAAAMHGSFLLQCHKAFSKAIRSK